MHWPYHIHGVAPLLHSPGGCAVVDYVFVFVQCATRVECRPMRGKCICDLPSLHVGKLRYSSALANSRRTPASGACRPMCRLIALGQQVLKALFAAPSTCTACDYKQHVHTRGYTFL